VGPTLGDDDVDEDNIKKWVKKSKAREKELAKKRLQELDNLDRLHQDEYTESMSHNLLFR
jgi:U4/U6.U5 tri-snRNP-associated protein 1